MQSSINDDEVIVLKRKVESLNMLLGTMHQESSQTIDKLEQRLKDQQFFNNNIMKILEGIGLSDQAISHNDDSANVMKEVNAMHVDESGDVLGRGPKDLSSRAAGSDCEVNMSTRISSCTQTNLAIDPETSVKLSFISAGISSYGNSIESSFGKQTMTSTPASSHQGHSSTQSHGRAYQSKPDRMSPTSLHKDFVERHSLSPGSPRNQSCSPPIVDRQGGRPPTFPSAHTPVSKVQEPQQQAPLKSILRTPTHDKPSTGPLSAFSPSLSPIQAQSQSLITSNMHMEEFHDNDGGFGERNNGQSMFNDSHVGVTDKGEKVNHDQEKNDIDLGASLFMSPLLYDSSDADGDGSLRSLSMLNVTANATLASGSGRDQVQHELEAREAHGHPAISRTYMPRAATKKKKKSPTTRRRAAASDSSPADEQQFHYQDTYASGSATSDEEGNVFRTPHKSAPRVRGAHTAGYNETRVNSMGFAKLHHYSDSKRTSGFWKERLGKRDLTSVLSSPISQKLF